MTKEHKDGFTIRDRRFWVDDEERPDGDGDGEAVTPPAAPPAVDAETLRSALADLEETKRRVQRDAERQVELMRAQVLEGLLPVLDNLERSIAAGEGSRSVEGLLGGVKLVHAQFLAALAPFGLSRRSSVGQRFDPRVHDAVAIVPVSDAHLDGIVIAEFEPAYVVGERVIRPAKVQVGRAGERPQS
jgi:molecular chaperone GrpE (heat shock protein)